MILLKMIEEENNSKCLSVLFIVVINTTNERKFRMKGFIRLMYPTKKEGREEFESGTWT